ncbi:alpha/beta hydrolase [Tissierella sp.]|uniref:alpha/beta fold hydrolase n=1 Tax=Tissierella sp. TaxID=41274 RepID=UPI00285C3925|nr:alpha/beta hydrolase [Tissierella sp.]MDR7857873.1 alpha/beta hydrolase [Tissierella sp.]
MNEINFEYKIIGNGDITLVIETGIGNSFYNFYPVIDKIKDYFTVIVYHRLGYGKSDLPKSARTTRNIASELNALLKKIGIKEKYILMGHSFGGLCVQQYSKMYPYEIEAVVLLDSTSYNLEQLENLDTPTINVNCSIEKMVDLLNEFSQKSREELTSENTNDTSKYEKYLTNEEIQNAMEFGANSEFYKVISDEFANWIQDGEDIKSIPVFPNVPLRVIARDKVFSVKNWVENGIPEEEAIKYEEKWDQLQADLALLSSQNELIIALDSDHLIHVDRPDVVINCLMSLVIGG